MDPATGKVAVERVVCAHDCGLVVNPDALKNQIEGSIIQSLSKMLYEEVKFDRSRVTSVDWASYPVIRFPEVPPIEIALIDRPDQPLMGGGRSLAAAGRWSARKCDLRRHRGAAADCPIHPGASQSSVNKMQHNRAA